MDLGKAKLEVQVDSAGARSGVSDVNRAFDIMRRKGEEAVLGITSSFDRLKDKIFSIQGLIAGFGLYELAKSFIEAGRSTEIFTDRLQVALGSVKEGSRLFDEMNKFALKSPFAFKEVMESATTLSNVVKGGVDEIKEWMPLISDLAAASGLGIQEATGQVVKMMSAGAGAADMFRERGILAMLGFTTGVQYSAEETKKKLIDAFVSPTSKFRDASNALMTTWEGATSNLGDAWFQFQQRVMVDGGVLNYLKAIVQVLTNDFTDAFGKSSGAAESFAKMIISGMKAGVGAIATMISTIKLMAVAIEALKTAWNGLTSAWYKTQVGVLSDQFDAVKGLEEKARIRASRLDQLMPGSKQATQAQEEYREALQKSAETYKELQQAQESLGESSKNNEEQLDKLFGSISNFTDKSGPDFQKFLEDVDKQFDINQKKTKDGYEKTKEFQSGLEQFAKAGGASAKQIKAMAQAHEQYDNILDKVNKHTIQAAGDLDPVSKAWADYATNIRDISQAWDDFVKLEQKYPALASQEAQMRDAVKAAVEAETKARDANIAKAEDELNVIKKVNQELDQQFKQLGLDERDKFIQQYVDKAEEAYQRLTAAEQAKHPWDLAEIEALKTKAARYYDLNDAMEKTKSIEQERAQMWQGALSSMADQTSQFLTGQIKSWKDFGKALLGDIQQLIGQIISQWIRLQIINPILNNMFGSALNLATSANASGGGGGSWMGMISNAFSGSSNADGGASGSGFNFGSPTSWMNAGKSLWNGFTGGWTQSASAGSSIFGSYSGAMSGIGPYAPMAGGSELGLVPNYAAGAPESVGVAPGSYGYTPSTFGYLAAGAAGVYAGYNRFQNSNKDFGGALGGVAYGVGTYSAAIGAGAALSGGMAAGLAAVPVVGWIALAAMAVDYLSGGKLFGTKGKLHHSNLQMDVNQEGISLAQSYTLKGQKAFFGGTKWTTRSVDPSDESLAAAADFFKSLQNDVDKFAKQWGLKAGQVAAGSFNQEFDKNGNPTHTTTTINGQEFKDETQEQFSMRIMAEGRTNVLKAIGVDITSYTKQFIQDAESYAKAVDSAAQATAQMKADIGNGQYLLDASAKLGDVFAVVSKFAQGGEDINQVYQDLMIATVGFRDTLAGLKVDIGKTGEDFVKFAKDISDAAGGAQAVGALYESFSSHYLTEDERVQRQNVALQSYATQAINDLGDVGKGTNFSNFRERFEKLLPTLSADDIAKWLKAGDALAKLNDAFGSAAIATTDIHEAIKAYDDILDVANKKIEETSQTSTEWLDKNRQDVMDIAASYDGSIESQNKLLAAVQYRYEIELQYLKMVNQVQESITANIQANIEDIKTSTMSDSGKYKYFKDQADKLAQDLSTMTDPEQIKETVDKIQYYETQAWSLLSEDQRKRLAQQYIDFLQGVQDEADQQLDRARDHVTTDNTTISQAVEDALKRAADAQQAAADTQTEAANTMLDAAHTLHNAEVRVIIVDNTSEVGAGGGGGRRAVQ